MNNKNMKNIGTSINEDALRTFVNALSTNQKQKIKALNIEGLKKITSYMKKISVTQNINKLVETSSIDNDLSRNYIKSFKDIAGVNTIASSYIGNIANLHLDELIKLSQFKESTMTEALIKNLSNLNYTGIIEILNTTLKKDVLTASDMSFLKKSKFTDTFKNELCYPSGFATALKTINTSTANFLANNIDLEFDLDKKCFAN